MSTIYELRDLDEARQFLAQGLWLQRVRAPVAAMVRPALRWALEVASGGHPLPPVGFVADLGHAALGADWEAKAGRETVHVPGLPPGLDAHLRGLRPRQVLRRLDLRPRRRCLAPLPGRKSGARPGAAAWRSSSISSGPRRLRRRRVESRRHQVAAGNLAAGGARPGAGTHSDHDGLHPLLDELYESLIAAARRTAEVLAPEDVFELEHGTALAEFGERVALRQVLQAAARLEATLPAPAHPPAGRTAGSADAHPRRGHLSRRRLLVALHARQHREPAALAAGLHGEGRAAGPVRREVPARRAALLLRDENQFLRRRRTFVFALFPDLDATRTSRTRVCRTSAASCCWRCCWSWCGGLSEWLSTDALLFEFLFLKPAMKTSRLARERELVRDAVTRADRERHGRCESEVPADGLVRECAERARRSLCHCLTLSTPTGRWRRPIRW